MTNISHTRTDEQAQAWQMVTKIAQRKGTPIFCQLWHCGRASHPSFQENGALPVAPSAIRIKGELHTPIGKQPYETPRALETEEIPAIVADYRQAAQRAKLAGFDGIEIHGANGYLIDTFLQSVTNQRQDKYGGSLANRYRFLQEVVEAILTVFPSHRVGVRLSPNGVYNDMGSEDFRETFLYIAQRLNEYNLAYLHLLDGLAFGFHEKGQPMLLSEFRAVFNSALIGNCGYTKEIFGNPPKAVVLGLHALIDSSATFHLENLSNVRRIVLNSSIAVENLYQGSVSFIDSSTQISGKNLRNSLKRE